MIPHHPPLTPQQRNYRREQWRKTNPAPTNATQERPHLPPLSLHLRKRSGALQSGRKRPQRPGANTRRTVTSSSTLRRRPNRRETKTKRRPSPTSLRGRRSATVVSTKRLPARKPSTRRTEDSSEKYCLSRASVLAVSLSRLPSRFFLLSARSPRRRGNMQTNPRRLNYLKPKARLLPAISTKSFIPPVVRPQAPHQPPAHRLLVLRRWERMQVPRKRRHHQPSRKLLG